MKHSPYRHLRDCTPLHYYTVKSACIRYLKGAGYLPSAETKSKNSSIAMGKQKRCR